jgi:hypothetical protein
MTSVAKRPRVTVDVTPQLRRRLRIAAAKRDMSVNRYVIDALRERLRSDLGDADDDGEVLTAATDPVLAELWDNPLDAEYDDSSPR